MQVDMRIPVTVDHDELIEQLKKAAEPYGLHYEAFDYVAPLYVPTDSHLVKTLMATYKDLTGRYQKGSTKFVKRWSDWHSRSLFLHHGLRCVAREGRVALPRFR